MKTPTVNGSNWMSALDGAIPITALNIPGTHDSVTKYCTFSLFSQTQSLTVEEQLYAGVRYFDMRFRLKNKEFICAHSISDCKVSHGLFAKKLLAEDIVAICKNFLEKNPRETILFQLKEDNTSSGDVFFELFYEKHIQKDNSSWFLENRTPSLDEARGKIILLRAVGISDEKLNDHNSGINFCGYPYVGTTQTTDFRTGNVSYIKDANTAYTHLFVQDSYKQTPAQKIIAMNAFIEEKPDRNNYNINMANCIGGIPCPIFTSHKINVFLKEYDFKEKGYFGIVGLDFATAGLCRKIYMCNDMTQTPEIPTECSEKSKDSLTEIIFNMLRHFFKP